MPFDRLRQSPSVDPQAVVINSSLGRYIELEARSFVYGSTVGDYAYAMTGVEIWSAEVGKFCSIAAQAAIGPNNHPTWRAAQHHFTYRSAKYGFGPDDEEIYAWRASERVIIGPDVWLGHGVKGLPGKRIGTGAVIGSGAVVSRYVPDYAVAVGVPAQVIKFRFPQEIQEAMKKIAWWNWDHPRLGAALEDFRNLSAEEFCQKYG
ncbi:MAG: chloramphenicol acetyltransferase [Deltaproteobacteria bacterium]|nr:chloramphenicol acetyltransferase [Deltaproteobacteria bacterium]